MSPALAPLDTLAALCCLTVSPAEMDDADLSALLTTITDEMARRGIGARPGCVPPGMNHLGPMLLAHVDAQRKRLGLESVAVVFLSAAWSGKPTVGLSIPSDGPDDPRRGFNADSLLTVLRGLGAMQPAAVPATLAAE